MRRDLLPLVLFKGHPKLAHLSSILEWEADDNEFRQVTERLQDADGETAISLWVDLYLDTLSQRGWVFSDRKTSQRNIVLGVLSILQEGGS